jgi:hypothetical protein
MGFEPMIPVFAWVKKFHALDCVATVIGYFESNSLKIYQSEKCFKQKLQRKVKYTVYDSTLFLEALKKKKR